jgi:dienelactone hydrolase
MDSAAAVSGQDGRNAIQLELLEGRDLNDAFAGLATLRARVDVNPHQVAVVGHSFGGALSLLMAQRDSTLKAAVDFAGGAASWDHSPPLRARLLAAARSSRVPIFVVQAANDYSIGPAQALGTLQRAKIFPAVGQTNEDGHAFIYSSTAIWEADVFAFLRDHM